jgi:hypothetical protein
MGKLIYEMAGGLRPGRKTKAVIPGGSSAKVLRADERLKAKGKTGLTARQLNAKSQSTISQWISIPSQPQAPWRFRRRDRAG